MENSDKNTECKILTEKLREDIDAWPNTTFVLVISHFEDKNNINEGMLIGPKLALTFSENIFREKFANKIEVALSWDGIAQHDKSDVEKFLIAEEFNLAVLLLAKNCEEKSGYLGLSSIIDPTTHNYFVYAFRKNEKKAEVVRVEKIRVENETIVYELNTPHDPITGSVLYFMDTDKKCYLVGIISHSEENNHYAFYLSQNRVNKIKDLILQLKQ